MAMDEFQRDVIDRLGRIETKLDNDYKALHGNGKPGLLDRVTTLESENKLAVDNVKRIEELHRQLSDLEMRVEAFSMCLKADKDWIGRIRDSIGWIVTTAIAIYAAFFR